MRIFISWAFIVLGGFLGINGIVVTAQNSMHQIIQNLYFIEALLSFVVAAIVYPKEKE